MSYRLGARRGLAACGSPTGRFLVLALDHRQNLRRELRPDDPESVTYDEMVDFKVAAVRALSPSVSGVLLDPEVGVAQAIADDALPAATGLIVAVEATGYLGPAGARQSRVLPGWSVEATKRIGASAAKALVYYHPDAPNALQQERFVADVVDACRRNDLALFLEPLSFGLDGGKLTGEDRRRVVVETARRLGALGPDVLKVEFPYDAGVTDREQWRDACAELNDAAPRPWVLLSGGVDDATFEAQLGVACQAGASGALVGRSVWSEAARMAEPERTQFLTSTGAARVARLSAIVEEHGHPWQPRWLEAAAPDVPGEGWFSGA